MTTLYLEKKKCAVCGKKVKYTAVSSTNAYEWPDLDMRPSEMDRSTMRLWVHTCPSCGYSASDLSKRVERLSEVVRSDSYQQQLNNPEFPGLANAFLCSSLIWEHTGNYSRAGWYSIYAAWACDDADNDGGAKKCRIRALSLLQKAKETGQSFAKHVGVEEAIAVDLLRRSGQFELALKACDGLKKTSERIISDILRFQKILISKPDIARHTVAEAIGEDK